MAFIYGLFEVFWCDAALVGLYRIYRNLDLGRNLEAKGLLKIVFVWVNGAKLLEVCLLELTLLLFILHKNQFILRWFFAGYWELFGMNVHLVVVSEAFYRLIPHKLIIEFIKHFYAFVKVERAILFSWQVVDAFYLLVFFPFSQHYNLLFEHF